mmetsp:Transcript_45321/g.142162  ORF Transcript_45321/g.142162 Transcript_45321/m.142162 type:complete len:286 (-) Transcript_45321:13-870(-)
MVEIVAHADADVLHLQGHHQHVQRDEHARHHLEGGATHKVLEAAKPTRRVVVEEAPRAVGQVMDVEALVRLAGGAPPARGRLHGLLLQQLLLRARRHAPRDAAHGRWPLLRSSPEPARLGLNPPGSRQLQLLHLLHKSLVVAREMLAHGLLQLGDHCCPFGGELLLQPCVELRLPPGGDPLGGVRPARAGWLFGASKPRHNNLPLEYRILPAHWLPYRFSKQGSANLLLMRRALCLRVLRELQAVALPERGRPAPAVHGCGSPAHYPARGAFGDYLSHRLSPMAT